MADEFRTIVRKCYSELKGNNCFTVKQAVTHIFYTHNKITTDQNTTNNTYFKITKFKRDITTFKKYLIRFCGKSTIQ